MRRSMKQYEASQAQVYAFIAMLFSIMLLTALYGNYLMDYYWN